MHPVDEPDGDGAHADVAARLHASLAAPELEPAVRQRHLQAIRDRAASLPAPAPVQAPRHAPTPRHVTSRAPSHRPGRAPAPVPAGAGWGRRLASTVTAAGLVMVMGASGAVAASDGALPGQALYPVKEVSERLVLGAPLPAGLAVDRHLTFADRRLDEAAALVDRDGDPALVADAIAAHARLMDRAGALAEDDRELAGRIETATLVARGRLAGLLDEGLPEIAAHQARAALSAVQQRLDHLDRGSAVPPPTPAAPPAPPRDPGPPEPRPDPPAPATPPGATPTLRAPADPGPPAEPGQPGNPPGNPSEDPGPGQAQERQPSPLPGAQPEAQPRQAPQETPRQQSSVPGPRVTPSVPADDRGDTGDRQRLPFGG